MYEVAWKTFVRTTCFVDYAHTPDVLKCTAITKQLQQELNYSVDLHVFGCGGNRDMGKRPEMGKLVVNRRCCCGHIRQSQR